MKGNVIIMPTSVVMSFSSSDIGSEVFTFNKEHFNYDQALKLAHKLVDRLNSGKKLKVKHYEAAKNISNIQEAVKSWSNGDILITPMGVTYKGENVQDALSQHLIDLFFSKGDLDSVNSWANYIKIINNSNSYKVANRLFMFLKQQDLRIDEDGNILAWKVVRSDYKDKYSGKFDNSPGQVLEMERSKVNDDDNSYCSYGFHVCSWNYLNGFASRGDRVVQVVVNPADIISIPLDYDGEKVRVCKYTVKDFVGFWGSDVDGSTLPKQLSAGYSA